MVHVVKVAGGFSLLGKNASSIKNITVFTPKNHSINREIRPKQGTQQYIVKTSKSEKNHNH